MDVDKGKASSSTKSYELPWVRLGVQVWHRLSCTPLVTT